MSEVTEIKIGHVDINEIDKLIDKVNIIDIREKDEIVLSGTLATAVHIPMEKLLGNPDALLDDDKEYYLLCHSGARSTRTCMELAERGYDMINIDGGFARYRGENRVDLY